MKNSLVSLTVVMIMLVSFVPAASAEVTFEKNQRVVEVIFKHMKWGWKQPFRFSAPTTTLLKTCVDNQKYECFYEVDKRGKERKLWQYRANVMVMVVYKFKTKTIVAIR